MEVKWFSELPLEGKVSRNFDNMRTEFAWFVAQDSTHSPITSLPNLPDKIIDLAIIIIPKKVEPFLHLDIVSELKRVSKKYAFMQEGPSWYFQSLPLHQTLWFYNIMLNADFVLAHNDIDKEYYEGLLGKEVYINPTLMIEDNISNLPQVKRQGIMLGGNVVRWYGGFDSLIVAQTSELPIFAPQMGRMEKAELNLSEINHLPYHNWLNWIKELNKVEYAIHLNPNTIGGTFNLNCAFLGIPCIGNAESNTQKLCFPALSVQPHEISKAKKLLSMLVNDKEFYNEVSSYGKLNYHKYFSEKVYKQKWNQILNQVI